MTVRLHAADGLECCSDGRNARFQLTVLGRVVNLQVALDCRKYSAQFFLPYLHAASDAAEGRHSWECALDQVFAAEQQSCCLRSPQSLAAGKDDQVEPQFRVLPQVLFRRRI